MKNLFAVAIGIALSASLVSAQSAGTDWPAYGNDPGSMKFSPLKQITPANVGKLKLAWTYDTGETAGTDEITPLVIHSVMYVATPQQHVIALNAETGKEIWKYAPEGGGGRFSEYRGVSYWPGDGQATPKIIFASESKLIELDAETGQLVPSFGENGLVDLIKGLDPKIPANRYSVTSPPAIYKNLAILGPELGETGRYGLPGDPRAFDLRTGKEVWRFHVVPQPGEANHDTWPDDSWQDRSGPSLWAPITVDTERGIVFCPVGNPTDQAYGGTRPGLNLYSSTLIALDAETGKMKWYFQITHHDIFDFDLNSAPTLVNVNKDGANIPAVAQMTKQGLLFILDRTTGKPVFGVEERPVPRSNVPGETAWPTQPFPVKPVPLARMGMTREEVSKISPETEKTCQAQFDYLVQEGPFTPYGILPTLVFPSSEGGGNWGGVSFDPNTGYIIVNSRSVGTNAHEVPTDSQGILSYSKVKAPFEDQDGLPCSAPPWGELIAVNANTGDVVWRVPLGEYADLKAKGVPITGTPNAGAPIVTASGVIFVGATTDYHFRAFDEKTGEELWSTQLENSAIATPITYQAANGKQYVATAEGGAGHLSQFVRPPQETPAKDLVVAYTLP
jgi:quinoprotein glucose dehydrogenase